MKILNLDQLTPEENIELNFIALEIRNDYNNLIERVSSDHIFNIHWIVGSVASRNKYQSPLFYRCCQIAFVQSLTFRKVPFDKVITGDKPLAILLKKEFGHLFTIECTENVKELIWRKLRPVRQIIISWILLFLRFLGGSIKGKKIAKNIDSLILVDTFVLNNKAGDEGSITCRIYKDRYYPGLLENMTDEQRKNVFFLPTIVGFLNPISIFKKIRSADYPFLLHDDYLKFSDYLFAMSHPLKAIRLSINDSKFRGVELHSIIKQEMNRNCGDFIGILGLLYYRFSFRLKEQGIKVKLFIEWYENQVMDRGMIAGFHKFMPETTILGYQGYIISKGLHLYTQPNNSEYDGGAVPDIVCVTGRGLINNIHEFCNKVKVEVAPGFRFQKLWRDRKSYPEIAKYTILIGLPIGLNDCKEILELFINDVELSKNKKFNFLVKPHPTWSPEVINSLFPLGKLDVFTFVLGDFHDSLEKANLVVSNASSVALEAVAKGTPVIIVHPTTGILQNPIPEEINKDCWCICSTIEEIKRQIFYFMDQEENNKTDFYKIGANVRSNYFAPVTHQSVQEFLELSKC